MGDQIPSPHLITWKRWPIMDDRPFVIESVPDQFALRLAGELDLLTTADVSAAIAACRESAPGKSVTIDTTDVTFIDCSGLRAFAAARLAGPILVHPRSEAVARLLELVRFDEPIDAGTA